MTTIAEPSQGSRLDRRKARTRASLIEAAQGLLAEQPRAGVSIQEITDAADVGFGSFYNHFSSKDELFDEAVALTLTQHAELIAELTADMDDPAEIFAASFRLTGRLVRQRPALVQVMLNTGLSVLTSEHGLAPHAQADITRGIDSGRFVVEEISAALLLAGGSLLALLQVLDALGAGHDKAADELADSVARQLLVAYGLTVAQAREVCDRPLPKVPRR